MSCSLAIPSARNMLIGLQKPQMKLQGSSLAHCSPLIVLCLVLQTTNAITYNATLGMGQSITTSDTIVSAGGNFELGFFTEQNSTEYFVGMWFKKIPKDKIVWVANRERPLTDSSSAMLTIYGDGNLAIVVDHGQLVYFITNISSNSGSNIRADLLDSGNFLLLDGKSLEVFWQSFDYPTDTLLPGMNIGFDQVSGYSWSLRSWTSTQDPRPGLFSLEANVTYDLPWALIIKKGSEIYWIGDKLPEFSAMFENQTRTSWNGLQRKGFYITWQAEYGSRLVLEVSGALNLQFWKEDAKEWVSAQSTRCGTRGLCGNYGVCNPQAKSPCDCLQGFVPYDQSAWKEERTSAGCVRRTPLLCSNISGNGFLLVKAVEFPKDNPPQIRRLKITNASTCQRICSSNCSCVAYAYNFIGECLLWHDRVLDLKNVSVDVADDDRLPSFFLKLAASDIENEVNTGNSQGYKPKSSGKKAVMISVFIAFAALPILGLSVYYVYYKRRNQRESGEDLLQFDVRMSMKVDNADHSEVDEVVVINKKEVKLPLFSFASVSAATDHFSPQNKLGEGGFGPVYKAKLLNGDEVAVKRLSTRSGQGWEELKNEVLLIAKLQHNNLVRLLGCCIEGDEKMLIYEFMPNKSLDFILFDAEKSKILDWKTRVQIIYGIAQGLLYLHQFSRFRIIHRDLKASNILLDIDMNPKISDFGMARMFAGNESQANTNRIVGTYGYMSPEYALEGLFSIKSDVFCFGVLLLEIITGKRNTGFFNTNSLNLLGYAWDLWTSGRGIQLLDPVLQDASVRQEIVLRYVNIALLCVQESPVDRPNMSDVVSMLGNENAVLAFPKPVAFLNVRGIKNLSSTGNVSENAMTASILEAR